MTMNRQFADLLLPELLRARGRLGLSRKDVASKIGVGYASFSSWERGDRLPSFADAVRWADAVDVEWPANTTSWFTRAEPGLKPCGTRGAFQRHVLHDEPPCMPCRLADNEYHRNWVRRKRNVDRIPA
jgi:transcriptional regulator with XRE-family HTH domain